MAGVKGRSGRKPGFQHSQETKDKISAARNKARRRKLLLRELMDATEHVHIRVE